MNVVFNSSVNAINFRAYCKFKNLTYNRFYHGEKVAFHLEEPFEFVENDFSLLFEKSEYQLVHEYDSENALGKEVLNGHKKYMLNIAYERVLSVLGKNIDDTTK